MWVLPMRWVVIGVCLSAVGCAQQRLTEAEATFSKQQADCMRAYPSEIGNYLPRANCLAQPRRAINSANGVPSDLVEVLIANEAAAWGQVDRGELTVEEANVRSAELRSIINERMLRRRNEALAAMPPPPYIPMQQAPIYTPPPLQLYTPPPPQRFQTTCQQIGQFTYCN